MDVEFLKDSIHVNETLQKKDKKTTYLSDHLLNIVENFMKKKKRICYGGTAINSILPKEKQFYNYDVDIPDYDFFSPTALEDAKELCNLFKKENIFHVEGKNAVSFGTYKVFVNFVPIADITQIHQTFYDSLLTQSHEVNGILYTPPSYLRMSLHQELARPKGDISRWEKIYQRMQLLNTYFPIFVKPLTKRNHMYISIYTKELNDNYDVLFDFFQKQNVVFCNFHMVSCVFKRHFKGNTCDPEKKEKFILYSDDLNQMVKDINALKLNKIKVKQEESIYKFIGNYAFVMHNDKCIGILFQTNSCLSYIETKVNGNKLRIGNIDTLLNLYFSMILMDIKEVNNPFIYHIIGELNKIVNSFQKHVVSKSKTKKIMKRFHLPCLGTQEDFPQILRTRYRKYKELKHNKTSVEYKKWFFKYTPNLESKEKTTTKNKTKKKKS